MQLSAHLLLGLVAYLVVGVICFCALALALTRLCATADSASAIGPLAATILAFLSGVFIPVAVMPPWMLDLGKVFPLEHLARGLQEGFLVPGSLGRPWPGSRRADIPLGTVGLRQQLSPYVVSITLKTVNEKRKGIMGCPSDCHRGEPRSAPHRLLTHRPLPEHALPDLTRAGRKGVVF